MIAGLETPTSGEILIGGQVVNDLSRVSVASLWSSRAMRSIRTSRSTKTLPFL